MAEYESILYSVEDKIARITFNRPEKRNALSMDLRREMVDALKIAERDDAVAVVLIDANGPSFCSGYDLSPGRYGAGEPETSPQFNWTDPFARGAIRDFLTIWDLMKPVVAKVHGYCLAGGSEMVSMCDIVFAADNAIIGHPAMRGMTTPDVPWFPWKLPMSWGKYMQLTGNSITGKKAAEVGMIVKSFPLDSLEDEVMKELRALASIAPDLLAANKMQINQVYEMQGFRTSLHASPGWHTLSGRVRPGAGDFGKISREQGLRAAIEWRDGAFRELDPGR